MGRYVNAFKAMPRALKWAVAGLAAVVLYFLAIEPAIDRLNLVDNRADQHEEVLRAFTAKDGSQQKAVQTIELGMRRYGPVEFLGDEATRPLRFNTEVDKILREHQVTNAKSVTKNASLGTGVLTNKMGTDVRVTRVVRDIEFDATPEAVAGVIAALERTPVVATVSRVNVRVIEGRDTGSRLVHATITAEAWIASKKG